MGSAELIGFLKEGFVAEVTEAQAKVAKVDELAVAVTQEVEAAYEEGLAKATGAPPTDARYTDAEVNKFIADAKAPLEARIAEQDAIILPLQAELDTIKAQFAEFKVAVKEKWLAQQAAEGISEADFDAFIK